LIAPARKVQKFFGFRPTPFKHSRELCHANYYYQTVTNRTKHQIEVTPSAYQSRKEHIQKGTGVEIDMARSAMAFLANQRIAPGAFSGIAMTVARSAS